MTASNVAATQLIVDDFLSAHFPWLTRPKVIEWDNIAGGSTYYTGNAGATISVPKYSDAWNDGRADIDIHECGHVLAFYLASIGRDPLVDFLKEFGASDALLGDRSKLNEIFAEHFVRAYLPSYDGHNRPDLVGLVPFDAAKMRAFCESRTAPAAIAPVVPTPLVPAPAPPTIVAEDLAAHYFSQWDGDHRGSGDCVPTCMKMLLSLYGLPTRTIGELRDQCDLSDNGKLDLGRDAGITLMAASLALIEDGLPATAMMARDVAFDDVVRIVREGTPCMVFVVYGYISNRVDQGFGGLHAIVLARADAATAAVLDPDRDFGGGHPDQRGPVFYAIDELRRGYDEGQAAGGGTVIPDDAPGGSDMMSPEKFREMFLDVYADIGAAQKFGELADQIGNTIHMVERVQAGDKIQDAEIAEAKATLDKLRAI